MRALRGNSHHLSSRIDPIGKTVKVGGTKDFVITGIAADAPENSQIKFDFGSDSPIEEPSLFNNLQAIRESALAGVPALKRDPLFYQEHSATDWIQNTFTIINNKNIEKVVFQGEEIFSQKQVGPS